jgi:hypothetical protein
MSTPFGDALARRAKLALAARHGKAKLSIPVSLGATTFGGSEYAGHEVDNGKGYRGNPLDDLRQPWSIAELAHNPDQPDVHRLEFNAIMRSFPLDVIRAVKAQRVNTGPGEDHPVGMPHLWPIVIVAANGVAFHDPVVCVKADVGRGNKTTRPVIDLRWGLAAWLGVESADSQPWQGVVTACMVLP